MRRGLGSAAILMAIIQHYVWAYCLFRDPSAVNVTALFGLKTLWLDNVHGVIYTLAMVASVAVVAFFTKLAWYRVVLMAPQQFILLVSALGASRSMWYGVFADGTVRTSEFLTVDQCAVVILAGFHLIAMITTAIDYD